MPWITDPQTGFNYWQDEETGQVYTPTSAEPVASQQEAPAPAVAEPAVAADKPDFTTPPPTETQREADLREALTKADANRETLAAEGQDTAAFDASVKDVAAKVQIIDVYKEAGETMPPDVKAVVYGPAAPFADLSKGTIDVVGAVKAGVSDSAILKTGAVTAADLAEVKDFIANEKETRAALSELNDYRTKDGSYDLVTAIRDGKIKDVRKAGFKATDVIDAQSMAAGGKAAAGLTGKAAFDAMMTSGQIPRGSRYAGEDEQGNVLYNPPFAGLEEAKADFESQSDAIKKQYVAQTFKQDTRFVSDSTTPQKPMVGLDRGNMPYDKLTTGEQEQVVAEWRRTKALGQMYGDMFVGLVPIVGTVYTWKRMSTPWKAVSVASDVLFVASFLPLSKVAGLIKGSAGQVDDAIKAARAAERATIKASAPKEVVKAYDAYVSAVDDMARNRAFIRSAERDMAKGIRPEAITFGPKLRTLEQAREIEGELAMHVKKTGDAFAVAQKVAEAKRLGTIGKAGIEDATLDNFGTRSVSNVRQVVDAAYSPKIPKVATIERQIKSVQTEMKIAEHDQDVVRIKELVNKSLDLQQQLKIAKSGEMRQLHESYMEVVQKIESGAYSPKKVQALRLEKIRLERQLQEEFTKGGFQDLEPIWQQPWSKGGGGLKKRPDAPPPGGGGGRPEPPPYRTTYAKQGAKLIARDAEGNEIWEIPGVRRIPDVPGKKTVRVEPQPYWAIVTAPTKPETAPRIYPEEEPYVVPQPETEPGKRPPFEPGPGKITWTPSIAPAPIPGQSPYTVAAAASQSAGEQAGASASPGTGTEPGTKTSSASKKGTADKPAAKVGTYPQPAPGQKPAVSPHTKPAPSPSPSPAPRPKGKTPTVKPVDIDTPHPGKRVRKPDGGADIVIESVKGVPANPGIVLWNQGRLDRKPVWVVITPPYREGTQDVKYVIGRPEGNPKSGTPRATVHTIKGKPPKEINLGMGIVKSTIKHGRHITFRRQHIRL